MIVVVTGGRDYNNQTAVWAALTALYQRWEIKALIHGDALGVDRLCGDWCTEWMVPCYPCPADWGDLTHSDAIIKTNSSGKQYDALAGHRRNQSMLEGEPRPTYGIVFPGGRGTADMHRRMIKTGLTVWVPYA